MPDTNDKAARFHSLHRKGNPLVLVNVWDAGSAAAVAAAGAAALATGSASVAGALGFADGEAVPIDLVLANARRITDATSLPVSLDFEGGYALDLAGLADNIRRVIATGIIGINFEDQAIGGSGLHPVSQQAARIAAIRAAAVAEGVNLFINARTDIWLDAGTTTIAHRDRLTEGVARGKTYADAGASSFFVPGLADPDAIASICQDVSLPVNVMHFKGMPGIKALAELGVARISYGPGPWRRAMAALNADARQIYSESPAV